MCVCCAKCLDSCTTDGVKNGAERVDIHEERSREGEMRRHINVNNLNPT